MKIALRFLAVLLLAIGLSVFGSLKALEKLESQWALGELFRRSFLVSESIHASLATGIRKKDSPSLERLFNKIRKEGRLLGIAACAPKGALLARSGEFPSDVRCDAAKRLAQEKTGKILKAEGSSVYRISFPVLEEEKLLAYLLIAQDARSVPQPHKAAQAYVVAIICVLSLFFSLLTLAVYRWARSDSVDRLKTAFRAFLSGEIRSFNEFIKRSEFSPLARDFSKVMGELRRANDLRNDPGSGGGSAWTSSRLRGEVQRLFGDAQLCVIANREPYAHNRKGTRIQWTSPASGLVTAVEPIVRACSGLWIAHGSGSADRETADSTGKLLVPPGKPEYALKRVWLTKAEEQGYYYGFSNEGLWPLCHIAHARPSFSGEDYQAYKNVNEKFARAFWEECKDAQPIALIQDYHFALLPQLIRAKKPEAILSLFWHIPWPNPEAFGICPWKKELLTGMLSADLIGFHTQFHCNNFLDTVDRFLEARVDREQFSVTIHGHVCYVKPFSISIEWPPSHAIPVERFAQEREELLAELGLPKNIKIGIGVDRIDYTKGLIERLRSVEKLLDKHPELVGNFVFIQIGAPSRTHIKRYQDLNSEVREVAEQINWKFSHARASPILLKLSHHEAPEVFRYFRAADLCFVSSLHDGMNLVAKEYVAARADNQGALLLSTFAGASRELTDALLVNPYDLEECANALHRALTMPADEMRQRMERMRALVAEKNVYAWAVAFLAEIHRVAQTKAAAREALKTKSLA